MDNLFSKRRYVCIQAPDNKHRIWIQSLKNRRQVIVSCSFSLANNCSVHPMIKAIDKLGYVSVVQVCPIDEFYSTITLLYKDDLNQCILQLIEDLPSLMDQFLALNNK